MKQHKKMFGCLMIGVICVSSMLLGACNRNPTQRTIDAAVNVMMMTNPMGSLYGKTSLNDADSPNSRIAPAYVSGTGCPAIDIALSVTFTPTPNFSGSIDLAYNNDCIVHGLALSGGVSSSWSLAGDLLEGLELESTITFDNFTMEGMSTDGTIYQQLFVEELIPSVLITGALTTTHADGKARSMEYDNLTATVDMNNYTQFKTIFPDVTVVDDNTAALVINGSATYTDENGMVSAVTFDNVKQPFGCIIPASGTLHLVNNLRNYDAIVDYGDGTCDTLITITVEGQEPEVIDVVEWIKTH
jgi:hypothetical protein